MARPSRNLDRALLAAGREIFPARGCSGLSVREVAEIAGVNLGMFHYHFKTREAFLRAVMQEAYEEMFTRLTLETSANADPVTHLRNALRVLARFLRDHRPFLARVLTDVLSGEACARDFLRENVPRHVRVLQLFIETGQKEGLIVALPFVQVVGVCLGSAMMPILVGGALLDMGGVSRPLRDMVESNLLSDAGLDERIELALNAIRATPAVARKRTTRKRRKP